MFGKLLKTEGKITFEIIQLGSSSIRSTGEAVIWALLAALWVAYLIAMVAGCEGSASSPPKKRGAKNDIAVTTSISLLYK